MPEISVIVPIYKAESFLSECINSIVNQSFRDIEIVLVDDGSPDNCPKICDEYAEKDSRIVVIHQKNGGISAARNAGIEAAKGKYISFCDSDDFFDEDFLSTLYSVMKERNADIVTCRFKGIYPDRTVVKSNTGNIIEYTNLEAMDELFFGEGPMPEVRLKINVVSWNKLYTKELFDNIRFPVGEMNDDVGTAYKLVHAAKKIVYIDKPLYNYRMTEESATRGGFNEHKFEILKTLRTQMEYFKSNSLMKYYEIAEANYYTQLINLLYYSRKYKFKLKYRELTALLNNEYEKIEKNPFLKEKMIKYKLFKISPALFCWVWSLYMKVLNEE